MTYKTILGIVPGLQATALVAANIPKGYNFDKKKRKNKIVKRGVKTIVGVGLIGPTASMINKLP